MEPKNLKKCLQTTFLIFTTAAIGISSCKKDRSIRTTELPDNFTTKQEAKIYVNKKLDEYGQIIAKLSQNQAMKSLVYV